MDESNILGALLGQAVADSIGASFEGQTTDSLHRRFETPEAMFKYAADAPRQYTDDTEMALAEVTTAAEVAQEIASHLRREPHRTLLES